MHIDITRKMKFDPDQRCLINKVTGGKTYLEPRLAKILSVLIESRDNVVSRNNLIKSIWNNYGSGEQLLTHSISMLRKHLDENVIRTVPKKGYVLEKAVNQGFFHKLNLNRVLFIAVFTLLILKAMFLSHH